VCPLQHVWPTATGIQALQRYAHNYVRFGRFEERATGRSWMSEDTARLARKEGGIALPHLTSEFLQLSVRTRVRWSKRGAGVRSARGAIMARKYNGPIQIHPAKACPQGCDSNLASTGAALAIDQPRTLQKTELSYQLRELGLLLWRLQPTSCVGYSTPWSISCSRGWCSTNPSAPSNVKNPFKSAF
jgi:hypothetical protein